MRPPVRTRVPVWLVPTAVMIVALLFLDAGRYVVSGLLSAVILLFALSMVALLVGLLVVLALPSRRRVASGEVPVTTRGLVSDYLVSVRSWAGRAPWRRPAAVMADAAARVRAQVAELPGGQRAFSNIEVRLSAATLGRLDDWMPLEDAAYQLASDYARVHSALPRSSRAVTIVIIRDDSVADNRARARGSFRAPTDPQAVALARCSLTGPLAEGEADRTNHTVLRMEDPSPLDPWIGPGRDGSTRLDPDRTVISLGSVSAPDEGIALRARSSRTPTVLVGPDGSPTVVADQHARPPMPPRLEDDRPTTIIGADAPTALPSSAAGPAPSASRELRLYRIDPLTGRETGQAPVTVTGARVSVGRRQGSEVRLIDRHVSRDHATLERSESGWAVTDIGSTWSTFVNGRAVPMGQLHPLVPGDVVEFGRPADPDVPATAFLVG